MRAFTYIGPEPPAGGARVVARWYLWTALGPLVCFGPIFMAMSNRPGTAVIAGAVVGSVLAVMHRVITKQGEQLRELRAKVEELTSRDRP